MTQRTEQLRDILHNLKRERYIYNLYYSQSQTQTHERTQEQSRESTGELDLTRKKTENVSRERNTKVSSRFERDES